MDEIAWTRRARGSPHDIGDSNSRDDPRAAERTVRRIVERASGLADNPKMGRAGSVEGTRELVVPGTPHIAIHRIRDRIEVLRIRHGAQRWPVTP